MSPYDARYKDKEKFIGKKMATKDFHIFKFIYKKDAKNYNPNIPLGFGFYFRNGFDFDVID